MSTMSVSKDDYGSLRQINEDDEDAFNGEGSEVGTTDRGDRRQGMLDTWLRQDFISSRFTALSISSRRLGKSRASSSLIFGPTDRSVEALVSKEQIDQGGTHQHYHSVDRGLQDSAVWHRRKVALLNRRRDDTQSFRNSLLNTFSMESQDSSLSVTSECGYKFDRVAVDRLHSERWVFDQLLVAGIGVTMAFVGLAVSKTADYILEMKLDWASERMEQYGFMSGFLSHVGISSLLALGAFLPVAYRPVSAGSGIAEAKAILNGVVIPQCTSLITAFCKGLSVISSVSASLPAGLEGPMIHLGLCLGANANRLVPHRYQVLDPLRTERSGIDYTAIGTAAGVAAAFRAPVSGILFAMEEGASFWSTELTWRCFLATCVTVISMYAIISASGSSFQVTSMDLFNGIDSGVNDRVIPAGFVPSFQLWEYAMFAIVGSGGGLIGAAFCVTNRSIAVLRRRLALTTIQKGIEVITIATVYASLAWILPSLPALTTCNNIADRTMDESYFRQFNCEEGEYSELATLLLNPLGGKGITLLFQEDGMDAFSIKTCMAAGTVQLVTLCVAFGMSISAGIFIPLLFIGACYGRAFAVAAALDPRTYAITGAAACLGGVVRVLISLTTIVTSTTSLSFFLTPVMVATLFAQFLGNWASGRPGIYDIILGLRNVPFLEESCPEAPTHANIRARNVMKKDVTSIGMEIRVSELVQLLREDTFGDFPVVDKGGDGTLIGLIARNDLLALLSRPHIFVSQGEEEADERVLSYADLDRARPKDPFLTGKDIGKDIKPEDLNKMIHISPYLQIAPHTILGHGSAQRAYEMFRCLGLRTLVVIDKMHRPIGIITRRQLHLLEEIGMEEDEMEMKRRETIIYNDLSKRFEGQFE